MRLDKLEIKYFKNLRDFTIDFDESSLTTILIGQNATGKSNLIEALVIIFSDLDLGASPSFPYKLSYICRRNTIEICADPMRSKEQVKVFINGKSVPYSKILTDKDRLYLPSNVFGYYSGPSNRLESHFEKHQERFYRALLKGDDKALRPLFYTRLIHSQFVLLAFFSIEDPSVMEFLKEYLWIEDLESVLFVMKKPPWQSKEGDPRFWYARGVVRDFLDRLYKISLAPLRIDQRVSVGFRKSTTLEHLYLFVKDIKALRDLASTYENQREFFKTLESTYISELISEVRIRVKVRNVDGSLTFRELSEGEQQLLTVLGLLKFTKTDESLFLLDEPDTHLNPAWSVQYLDFLNQVVGDQETSHVIMATHDPLVISGLKRSQVQIMRRDEETGKVLAEMPEQDPKGMGVAAILTSELFGLRSTLDIETLNLLDRKRWLSIKKRLNNKQKEELSNLNKQLSSLDFTTSVRDPLYEPFVKAITALEEYKEIQRPILNKVQKEKLNKMATDVLQKIKSKEAKS